MQSDQTVVQFACCGRSQQVESRYSCIGSRKKEDRPSAVVTAFLVYDLDSDIMRHVGGGVLNNPVTRASQSRGGGRIPRAGRLKKSRITQRRLAPYEGQSKRRANFGFDHGKATLCSGIHHRGCELDSEPFSVYDHAIPAEGDHHA
jgi:hypothetical protein